MSEEQKSSFKSSKVGALWKKISKKSEENYLSGIITINGQDHKIVVFNNKKKEEEKHPDYIILLNEN